MIKHKLLQEYYRKSNVFRVARNQRAILNASRSQAELFLHPVPPPPLVGHVEHYYHFVFDLIMPLNSLLRLCAPDTTFVFAPFGIFTERLEQLFPGRTRIQTEAELPGSIMRLPMLGMDPLGLQISRRQMADFAADILGALDIETTSSPEKILLIERLPPDRYFLEEAHKKGAGTFRRSILNHEEFNNWLAPRVNAPFTLHNLQLEKTPFREQLALFNQAAVVIAQHGAGLANCAWMNPGTAAVELSSDMLFNHFVLISKARNQSHHLYRLPSSHAAVDTDDFGQWLAGQAGLQRYFSV